MPVSPGNGQSQSVTGSRQYNSPTTYDYSQDPQLIVTDDNFVALIAQIYENPEKFLGKDISIQSHYCNFREVNRLNDMQF